MSLAGVVIGLTFIIPGGIMLLIRLYHRGCMGEPWNNMPVVFTWAFAIGCAGVAVILTGLITKFTLKCEGGCQLEGGSTTDGTIVSGAIVAGIALCCGCCNRYRNEDKVIEVDWENGQDNRGYMSGLDFVFLGIGLAILATEEAIGECPQSCATPVVSR